MRRRSNAAASSGRRSPRPIQKLAVVGVVQHHGVAERPHHAAEQAVGHGFVPREPAARRGVDLARAAGRLSLRHVAHDIARTADDGTGVSLASARVPARTHRRGGSTRSCDASLFVSCPSPSWPCSPRLRAPPTRPAGAAGSAQAPTPGASAAAGGGAACAKADTGATATVKVDIKDFKFSPQPVNAKVGDVVGWTNGDSAPHTATMDDSSCGTDNISQGATGLLVFNKAGTYTYHCSVHPAQMKDYTIIVQ